MSNHILWGMMKRMKIIKDKKEVTIIGANPEYVSFSNFQNKTKEGQFYKLEEEFLAKLTNIAYSERIELKHTLKNEIQNSEFNTSFWLAIAFPSYIAIITIFGSVYISINNLLKDKLTQSIAFSIIGLVVGIMIILITVKVGIKLYKNKELEKFFRFYYDIIAANENLGAP
ncbi:hypothetical protein J23TS9_46960 [Paenibacillus sp. J23TS9]|uniref:hypothetical protein n=1 Tax=Paenibacillus sp. J23TS9 TaxID=2807193 RepID=UPI001B14593C|nr:hypothetical protein [Paenibacillus sp. J23TS9]GIP29566.1 hypothetical protein J23TS9_46960 [Paenibacillus sp. J23TS9]